METHSTGSTSVDPAALDLAALDTTKGAEQGFELQLRHPVSGAPLPLWITIVGTDSDVYQEALRAQQRKRMALLKRGRRHQLTPEDLEEDSLDLLAAASRSWRSEMKLDGQDFPPFSPAAVKQLYKRFKWSREQVDQAMGDRADFLPRSAPA